MTQLYAYEIVLALALKVPIIGEIRSSSRSLLFAKHVYEQGAWVHHQELCAIEIQDNVRFTETTAPQAFVDAIAPRTVPLQVQVNGEYTHLAWDTPLYEVGYRSSDGVLPLEIDEASVIDWDNDGFPAATLLIKVPVLGEVSTYVVQKSDLRYSVSYKTEQHTQELRGSIEFEAIEQRILDASNPIFKHSAAAEGISDESYFKLVPISKSGCEAALAALYPLSEHSWLKEE